MQRKLTLIGIAGLIFLGSSVVSVNALAPETDQPASITSCIEKTHKLDVLMVVDESISLIRTKGPGGKKLPGTDMEDERVIALKAVTEVLLDTVTDSDPKRQSKVSIALAGFGNGYNEHQKWMDLNAETVQSFQKIIEDQADRESSQFTRYHLALKGALATFANKKTDSGATCRMLIWFSDGQHDDDDAGKFMNSKEESQVKSTICGPNNDEKNGLADQLRLQDVYTVAAGLNQNESALGLMKLVSQGEGVVRFKDSQLDSCGAVEPEGKFASATKAGELVSTLVRLLSPVIDPPPPSACKSGEVDCSEYSFVVDNRVSRFTLFVDRGDDDVTTTLESEQTGARTLFEKFSDPNIKQTLLSENDAFVRVQHKQDGSINGKWTLKFKGLNHADAHALFRFVGDAKLEVSTVQQSGQSSIAKSIDRYETENLIVTATSKTDGASLEGVRIELKTRDGLLELNSVTENGKFVVPPQELQRVLNLPEINNALEIDLIVTPLGSVEGITDSRTGKNMPIDFGEFTSKLRITNGVGLPEYLGLDKSIPGVDADGNPIFKGTNKKTIGFQFKGASASDSVVTFADDLESDIGLRFVSGQRCEIPKATLITCKLELKPSKDSNGTHPAIVKTTSASSDSEKKQPGEITIKPETQLPDDVTRGGLTALLLVLSFLLIQGLQRFFFAWLVSRFGALSPTARRARIDIRVTSSGDISGESGSGLSVKTGEESFVFENTEPNTQFILFGYEFTCSAWNTFKKSGAVPLGRVMKTGSFVFGSAGVNLPKRSQILDQGSEGSVELSLRGQWVIGITNSDFQSLAGGTSEVPAELVVYLNPFEQVSLEQQLAEMIFTISAGRFPGLLMETLEKVRTAIEDSIVEEPSVSGGDQSVAGGGNTNPLDPFDLSFNSESTSDSELKSGNSFLKKIFSRKTKTDNQESSSGPAPESNDSGSSYLDPFSN
jgi:hypothetical protein